MTVECNPDTVTPELVAAYRAGGVNRLSFGVQSMAPHVLAALGRTHDPGRRRAGGGHGPRQRASTTSTSTSSTAPPGETPEDWRATLDAALALDPPHVSAYALTVEPATPLARRIGAGEVTAPDDDDQAEKYLAADAALSAAGRPWYEISNWARPGRECRHNLLYWAQGEYLGIGCAAHGHSPAGRRWWNVRTPDRYIALVDEGVSAEGGHEVLEGADREGEAAMLALRTRDGVPSTPAADGLVADGLAEPRRGRVVLTPTGRLLANEATTRLLLAHSPC